MITLQATGPSGVTDTLQIVVTNPSFGAPPGPTIAVTSTPANPEPGEAITFTATLTPPTAPPACNTQASPLDLLPKRLCELEFYKYKRNPSTTVHAYASVDWWKRIRRVVA